MAAPAIGILVANAAKKHLPRLAASMAGQALAPRDEEEGGALKVVAGAVAALLLACLLGAYVVISAPLSLWETAADAIASFVRGEDASSVDLGALDAMPEDAAVAWYRLEERALESYAKRTWSSGTGEDTYNVPDWRYLWALDSAVSENDFGLVASNRDYYRDIHLSCLKAVRVPHEREVTVAETVRETVTCPVLVEREVPNYVYDEFGNFYVDGTTTVREWVDREVTVEREVERTVVETYYSWGVSYKPLASVFGQGSAGRLVAGTKIDIPSGLGDAMSYMGWQMITSTSSTQYRLRELAGMNFDSEGFGVIDGRYVIACTSTFGRIGDYIDFYLDNGEVLKCVMGDEKSQADPGCNEWGHENGQSVVEFIVDKGSWYSGGRASHANPGTPGFKPEWSGCVDKAVNGGSWFDGSPVEESADARSVGSEPGKEGRLFPLDVKAACAKNYYASVKSVSLDSSGGSERAVFSFGKFVDAVTHIGADASYEGLEGAVEWAVSIAEDDSHGYSQPNREGSPDYDCSSLVYFALLEGGWTADVLGAGIFTTSYMGSNLEAAGFTRYVFDASDVRRGDVLWRPGHTEIAIGEGKRVGAHCDESGGIVGRQPGDQTGHEIDVSAGLGSWTYVYRYEG